MEEQMNQSLSTGQVKAEHFGAWREAVNSDCAGLTGDEVRAGYYRVRYFGGEGYGVVQTSAALDLESSGSAWDLPVSVPATASIEALKAKAWLPVAIWWDEGEDRFICLVDGQEVHALSVWPHCRSYPVPYEDYVLVAENGGSWPERIIDQGLVAETTQAQAMDQDISINLEHSHGPEQGMNTDLGQSDVLGSGLAASLPSPTSHSDIAKPAPTEANLASAHAVFIPSDRTSPSMPPSRPAKGDWYRASIPAGLGHNQEGVSKDQILSETLSDLKRDCFNWLDGIGVIQTQKQADQAGSFAEKFSSLEKEAEEARTVEKRPVLDQGRAIDAKWKHIVNSASDGKKRMKRALEPFLIAERERLEDEARRNGDLDDLAFSNPKAGLYGRKISLRSSYVLSIHDEEALRDYFAKDKRFWRDKEVRQVFKRLADADLHAGRDVPGAKLVQELTAA
jgi:hypothetical protein